MSDLDEIINRLNRSLNVIPARVAILAVNFSKERFVRKNWYDTSPEVWAKTRKKKGSTLVTSGRLKRSIHKISVSSNRVVIGTNAPYAQIHNEGGEISGVETVRGFERKPHKRKGYKRRDGKRIKTTAIKGHNVKSFSRKYHRKFKKRQFIGQSEELNRRVTKLIKNEIDNAIRGI